ncbi:MAG: hypothetical protein OXC38_00900 [Gammaproteobacteria bacterium]|nr:hypothetical protein [Gammaproteobacteria bacterium]
MDQFPGLLPALAITLIAVISGLCAFFQWKGAVNTDRTNFKAFMEKIDKKIDEIFSRLPPRTTGGQSPIRLTEMGEEISGELNAKAWAKKTAPEIVEKVKGKSEYEIQEECNRFARAIPLTETRSAIQACDPSASGISASMMFRSAYQHGIEIEQVQDVLGVELRDAVLSALGLSPPS